MVFNAQIDPDAHVERPCGYAWLPKLYGEVKGSNGTDRTKDAYGPRAAREMDAERYVFYLYDSKTPHRFGTIIH